MTGKQEMFFLTVDWCKKGNRGVFSDTDGHCFRKDNEPHTMMEMISILGSFWIILAPESKMLTTEQIAKFTEWVPLEEYNNAFGIALRPVSSRPRRSGA